MFQKWPNTIFPVVHFGFSIYSHFGLVGGGGGGLGPPQGPSGGADGTTPSAATEMVGLHDTEVAVGESPTAAVGIALGRSLTARRVSSQSQRAPKPEPPGPAPLKRGGGGYIPQGSRQGDCHRPEGV